MADNSKITQGTIESLSNCYALKINGAQGQPFFFNPQVPKEQIEALQKLDQYAKANKIEITNKADFPTLSNNIELVSEDAANLEKAAKIIEGMASIFYGKLDDGDKDLTLDQLLDKTKGRFPDLIKPVVADRQGTYSTTFEPNPMLTINPSNITQLLNDFADKASKLAEFNVKTTVSKEEAKDMLPTMDKDGKGLFESEQTFSVMAGLELMLESKISNILALGYSKDDVVKMLNHIVEGIE